jgi:protein SCO1/2
MRTSLHLAPALCLAFTLPACGGDKAEFAQPDDFGTVADFVLVDQDGNNYSSDQLAGKVWVIDFFFTRCPSVCPRMTAEMKDLLSRSPQRDDLHFVSMTIDETFDTPEVLRDYIATRQLDTARWTFLTGDGAKVRALSRDSFYLALGDEMRPDGDIIHSTKFVVVDRDRTIRAYFSSLDEDDGPRIDALIQSLLEE